MADLHAPLAQCSRCGRKTWDSAEVGSICNMPQPQGFSCWGRLEATDTPLRVSAAAPESALTWAVSRWKAEVANRPLANIHRRTLDDTWRQVVRYFGGDPDALLGPTHDALLSVEETWDAGRSPNCPEGIAAKVATAVRPPSTPEEMLSRPGLYVCGDKNHPKVLVPVWVTNGHAYSMKPDEPLTRHGFLPTWVCYSGPHVAPAYAKSKD